MDKGNHISPDISMYAVGQMDKELLIVALEELVSDMSKEHLAHTFTDMISDDLKVMIILELCTRHNETMELYREAQEVEQHQPPSSIFSEICYPPLEVQPHKGLRCWDCTEVYNKVKQGLGIYPTQRYRTDGNPPEYKGDHIKYIQDMVAEQIRNTNG